MSVRTIGIVLLGLVVAAGAGWLFGSSGRSAAERDRAAIELRAEFMEARALVLEARVSLYLSNFGDAVKQFQTGAERITNLQGRLRAMGQAEQASRLETAISSLRDAAQSAATFDTTKAHAAADLALGALQAAEGG